MTPRTQTASRQVLIVSNGPRGIVARAALECGLVTEIVRDISEAIGSLRRKRYQAVLADLDASNVDCLELVLNVRDFDRKVPIAVVATEWDAAEMAAAGTQPGLLLVSKSERVSEIANNLARLPLRVGGEVAASF
ncbi:MAG: hypothetical protein KJ060_12930 [Candidatus Hydrogenedentes bacterium]|nr:hypothetical protein [Candidatus Hydrogenedentota bacterium]